jgi:tetratricopeptide (TPR) repeat protein
MPRGGERAPALLVARWGRGDAWFAALLGVAALLALRLWRYPAPFPGDCTRHLAEVVGAWPRLSPQAPLWHLLARGVAGDAVGGLHIRLQWMGHLALAATAGLLYRAVLLFVLGALDDDGASRWGAAASRLAAAGSAVFLVACPPVWQAAQSPHPAILGLFLAVAASSAALGFAATGAPWRLLLWAALAGLGAVETPLVLLLLPVWVTLFVLLPFGALTYKVGANVETNIPPWIAGATVFGLAALCGLLAAALPFRDTEGFVLRGFGRTLHVLVFYSKDCLRDLRGALPAMGWLVVLVGLLAPWMLVMSLARRVQNGELGLGLAFLYVVAAVATTLQATGPSSVQLWSLLGPGVFRLGACLVSAMTFGLIAAAWLLEAERAVRGLRVGRRQDAGRAPWGLAARRLAQGAVCLALGIGMLAAVATVLPQRREAGDRAALRALSDFVRQTVDDAGDCEWVVTDGLMDAEIRLAAWQAGSRLQPLRLLPGQEAWTRRAIARRLPDEDSRSLFAIGAQPLLRDWIASRPEQTAKVAAQIGFDLWAGASTDLLPQRTVFRPIARGAAGPDRRLLVERHRPFWSLMQARLDAAAESQDPLLTGLTANVRYHVARVANELGVRLEDEGDVALAVEAYTVARTLNPENLSARMNLQLLSQRKGRVAVPQQETLAGEIRRLAASQGRSSLVNTVRLHGTVRSAKALAALGAGQALGPTTPEAADRVEAALRLVPKASGDAQRLRTVLAGLRWRDGNVEGGRQAYLEILKDRPDDVTALLGLAALEAASTGLEFATPLIDRARKAGAKPLECDQLQAMLCLDANDAVAARTVLRSHVERRVKSTTVWYLWGQAALQLRDAEGYALAQAELGRLPKARAASALLAAQEAESNGDLRTALLHARAALAEEPSRVQLLAGVLRLCTQLGDYDTAQPVAERLLAIEPGHGLARYALGTQLLLKGDAKAAEAHLARAVEVAPDAAALNNLACARLRLGRTDEARRDAQATVELAAWHPETWDTLAAVAIAQNDVAAAQESVRQLLVLAPESATAWLRAAEAAAAAGNDGEARACLDRAAARTGQGLGAEAKARMDKLRRQLAAGRALAPTPKIPTM